LDCGKTFGIEDEEDVKKTCIEAESLGMWSPSLMMAMIMMDMKMKRRKTCHFSRRRSKTRSKQKKKRQRIHGQKDGEGGP
jgi:hypothetical protein